MNIFLKGYFDNNLGDDLMIKAVLDKYPEVKFYTTISSKEIKTTYVDYKNLIFYEGNRLDLIKKMDGYLTLGGSVFQFYSLKDLINRLKKIVVLIIFRIRKKPIYVIGANIGPFKYPFGKILTKLEIKLTSGVSVRDNKSFQFVKKIKKRNITLADDLVFECIQNEKSNTSNFGSLGISTYYSIVDQPLNEKTKCSLLYITDQFLSSDRRNSVKLFAFDTLGEYDHLIAEFIYENSKYPERIKIVKYMGNDKVFLEEFMTCNKMIAMRFHSAILSDIFEIPYFPLAYSNKMTNYIKDSYSCSTINLSEISIKKDLIVKSLVSGQGCMEVSKRKSFGPGHLQLLDRMFADKNA